MGGLREGSGRLGYRSVTPPGSTPPPAGWDLGALPAAMPVTSDRAALAPYRRRPCDPGLPDR